MSDTTPMMKQYQRIKHKAKDAILFFRLGDFYEMFQQDAREASALLNLTLTQRNGIPMCGIPYHAAHSYIARLLNAGKKIAICEQITLPKTGRGIVDRDIVEIITPGTVVDENYLDKSANNYLVSLGRYKYELSFAYLDSSTGEFYATSFAWDERAERLKEEINRLKPREMLIQESLIEEDSIINNIIHEQQGLMINRYPDWYYDLDNSRKKLEKQFSVANLKGFGITDATNAILSTGVLLEYLEETSKALLPHIREIRLYGDADFLRLDESTQKNLEIVRNLYDGGKRYTLLEVLDYTKTSMGSRKLRKWLLHPLNNLDRILARLNKVDILYRNQILLASIRENLGSMLDIERLSARVAMDKANAKDLLGIKNTIFNVIALEELLKNFHCETLFSGQVQETKNEVYSLAEFLDRAIMEDPSIVITEGRLIKNGYSEELDTIKKLKKDSQMILNDYLKSEKDKTGISSLKIRYNKIIGHFLEVTKANSRFVPGHFIRRQSLVGSERYTTDKLIELETSLNNAAERIIELEKQLFLDIRARVKKAVPELLETADYISDVDSYASFAQAATIHGFTMPKLDTSKEVIIIDGRHPVVEAHLPPGEFIPNSVQVNSDSCSFILLTGPNMAGKSTFLRQTALIVLMAQAGSFVPAQEAKIGIVDKIFCRVGASDNLARGESTFLVEMNETANILRSATERSLIIMDEVGRGTGTNDGLSLAWAVSEYILDKIHAKTLFATHYQELTQLEHPKITNLSMDVLEKGDEVIFLKKVKKGPSSNSYGIHVAELAGLPGEVIGRAKEVLKRTLLPASAAVLKKESSQESKSQTKRYIHQGELFSPYEMLAKEIASVDINNVTPVDALNLIARWKKELL
ncbi:MAG: DNA mismatch repair protein MutS [Spirochaetota bacterium]